MNFDWKRWKIWDYVVLGLFVLIIIGVSLTWWKVDVGGAATSLGGVSASDLQDAQDLGIDIGSLAQQAAAAVGAFLTAKGWDFGSVVFCFILSLLAFLVVVVKPLFPINKDLPKWYMEALATMVFGGLITFITFLRLAVAPEGGHSVWNPGAGGFITLIAGLVMLAAGYMMWRDKTGAYGKSVLPKITTHGAAPPAGYQPPPGAPPGAGAFCSNCGAPLAPGDTVCKNCGKPV
jgi:hypothetical protein